MGMKALWEVRKVKKSAKIVSALLVLVLMMAQIVCVNAAGTPSFSYSTKQVDHYEKQVTISVTNGSSVGDVWLAAYETKEGKKVDDAVKYNLDGASTFSVSMNVRPNDVGYMHFVAYDKSGAVLKDEWYAVGGNSYYDINAGSGSTSSNGTYDGLINSGSSGSTWNGSYNNGSNVWDYYDPNAWYGYYDETRKDTTTYFVTCRTLNVRKGAGTSYGKVGTLSRNTAVEVYSIEKGWAVIEFNGHLRYVSAKYLSK